MRKHTLKKKMIGQTNRNALRRLCGEYDIAQLKLNEAESKVVELYGDIRNIVDKYDLPTKDGPSEYLDMLDINLRLRVTRPERSPKINPPELLKRIGIETFLEVCTITGVTLNTEAFLQAVIDEVVTEKDLLDSLVDPKPQKPTIVVSHFKTEQV